MRDLRKFYVGGRWVASEGGTDFPVINPATEEVFAMTALGTTRDVARAVAEERNRPALLAEAMVDPQLEVIEVRFEGAGDSNGIGTSPFRHGTRRKPRARTCRARTGWPSP